MKTHREILDFHNEVDRLAHMICDEMGLNPIEVIAIQYGDDWTPFEAAHGFVEALKRERPKVSVERWRAYRQQAALELAGFRALHKYILTEK